MSGRWAASGRGRSDATIFCGVRTFVYLLVPSGLKLVSGLVEASAPCVHSEIMGQFSRLGQKSLDNTGIILGRALNVSIEGAVSAHPWRVTFFVVAILAAFGLFIRRLLREESAYADELAHKARLD